MGKPKFLDTNTQIRITEIYCESEEIHLQCNICKSPLIKIEVPMEGIRYALYNMMYCKYSWLKFRIVLQYNIQIQT